MNRDGQVARIFNDALLLPREERAMFLTTQCGDDDGLRREVESLLDSYKPEFLESPPQFDTEGDASEGERSDSSDQIPEFVGPHRVLRILDKGGMGVVYLADQAEPLRRQVAVKVIKLGMDSEEVLASFRSELRALAVMDHPNIAKAFDGGTTDRGRPYFVMEYVPGAPITDHCDQHKLTLENRLKLFVQVCHAVQHAHQKSIIHRDIKPSNVLVAPLDVGAIPKVIDFGIAKSLAQSGDTVHKEDGRIVGTIAYMSPEQARMNATGVDTRTDIYSLGVLLYALVSGRLPFDFEDESTDLEKLRIIQEEEPLPPSARMRDAKRDGSGSGLKVESRIRQVRGDLDGVVLKAMAKDPDRRYSSASELAADIDRFLRGDPVLARPPAFFYRAGKLLRKHRGLAASSSLVFIALVAGFVVNTVQYLRTERAIESLWKLADLESIHRLESEADDLWPAVPENVAKMKEWLGRAGHFGAMLESTKAGLEEFLRDEGHRLTLSELTADQRRLNEQVIPDVMRRLEWAASVEARSIEQYAVEWRRASERVRSSAVYGFELLPQLGLVPLGPDPRSGLEEFAHLQTGTPPSRLPEGDLNLEESTGLVFVLLPGDTFLMGASVPARELAEWSGESDLIVTEVGPLGETLGLQTGDRVTHVNGEVVKTRGQLELELSKLYSYAEYEVDIERSGEATKLEGKLGPNVDPMAGLDEGPVVSVKVAPFFISKYEMTQGQWERSTGESPSSTSERELHALYPVEQVSWDRCHTVLTRLGLVLPTEAQWEYATRANSPTVWWKSDDREDLRTVANLADLAAVVGTRRSWFHEDWNDGFALCAPVGKLDPNPFGLHDVHGNVWEWCRDAYVQFLSHDVNPGDGEMRRGNKKTRVVRGGDFIRRAERCRSATRYPVPPELRYWTVGVRPAREISR